MWPFGPPRVAKLQEKCDVQGLIAALAYRADSSVRSAAARALGSVGDSSATQPLLDALKDDVDEVTLAAIVALGELREPAAIVPLFEELRHRRTADTQAAALEALLEIGGATAPVLRVLHDAVVFGGLPPEALTARLDLSLGLLREVLLDLEARRAPESHYACLLRCFPKELREAALDELLAKPAAELETRASQDAIRGIGGPRAAAFFEELRRAELDACRTRWSSWWTELEQKLAGLGSTDTESGEAFLRGRSREKPSRCRTIEEVLSLAVRATDGNRGDFSELARRATLQSEPIPHLLAPHSWRQTSDAWGTDYFLVVKAGVADPCEFLVLDVERYG